MSEGEGEEGNGRKEEKEGGEGMGLTRHKRETLPQMQTCEGKLVIRQMHFLMGSATTRLQLIQNFQVGVPRGAPIGVKTVVIKFSCYLDDLSVVAYGPIWPKF